MPFSVSPKQNRCLKIYKTFYLLCVVLWHVAIAVVHYRHFLSVSAKCQKSQTKSKWVTPLESKRTCKCFVHRDTFEMSRLTILLNWPYKARVMVMVKVKESFTHINNLLLSPRDPPLETSLNFLRMTGMFLQQKKKFFLNWTDVDHIFVSCDPLPLHPHQNLLWMTVTESLVPSVCCSHLLHSSSSRTLWDSLLIWTSSTRNRTTALQGVNSQLA